MSRLFSTLACLVLLCAQIALGATAAEAAGIGGHLGGMRKTFRERLQGGTIRMSALGRALRRHRS
jgi:hypothetical protein